jgi:hypothetical protein
MRFLLSLALLAATALPSFAQHPPVRVIRSTRPINVDSQLDEVWQNGDVIVVHAARSDQGQPPPGGAEVQLAYDDDALCVARALRHGARFGVAQLSRRDDDPAGLVQHHLDLPRQAHSYYFTVTAAEPSGRRAVNDGWDDSSWDGVWQARARRDGQGWAPDGPVLATLRRRRNGVGRELPALGEPLFRAGRARLYAARPVGLRVALPGAAGAR